MKKILAISERFYPEEYGAEKVLRCIITEINKRKKNIKIDVLTRKIKNRPEIEYIDGIKVFRLLPGHNNKFINFGLSSYKAPRIINKISKDYDLIWSNCAFPVCIWAYFSNKYIKKIITVHGGDICDYPDTFAYKLSFLIKPILKKSFLKADSITCVSQELEKILQNQFKIEAKYIPNGVKNFYKKSVKFNKPTIITASRLEPHKGIDRVILAFTKLKNPPNFIICGNGSQREYLINQTKKLGLKNVEFKGYLNEKEIFNLYSKSHAFIRLSETEGSPLVFLEAMEAEIPIITSNQMKILKYLHNNVIFVDRDNLQEIADAIKNVIYNNIMVENLKQNAKNKVKEFYWSTISKSYSDIFESS